MLKRVDARRVRRAVRSRGRTPSIIRGVGVSYDNWNTT